MKATQAAVPDPALLRRSLLMRMRAALDEFDIESTGFSRAEREARASDLETRWREAERSLVDGRGHEGGQGLVELALNDLGASFSSLEERHRRFARVEGLRAYCDLLALKAESARDLTRTFPRRYELFNRRQMFFSHVEHFPGTGGLSLELIRSVQGFTAEDGTLRLSEVFRRFLDAGRAEARWKRPDNTAGRDYGPIFKDFIGVVGDCRLAELTVSHTRRYAEDVRARQAATSATKAKYLDRVAAVLCWARDQGMVQDVTRPLRMTPTYRSYEAFTIDDLRRLFECEAYREVSFGKAAEFWAPLLALYTGARVDEIASIRLDAIDDQSDAPSILLSPDGRRTGKNDHSRRRVPIHPVLIEIGFLRYVRRLRGEGHVELFPEVRRAARDGKGKRITDDFQAFRRACGVGALQGRGTKNFHSFRATLTTALQAAGVSAEVRRAIIGHAPVDVHERTYSQGEMPMAEKARALAMVRFAFRHPRWRDTESQRCRRAIGHGRRNSAQSDRKVQRDPGLGGLGP